MADVIEATFQIVTPMFLGGANQTVDDGIRPPSVKGALRFWWRALNWARLRAQTSTDESALMLLHDEEARLFGVSADGSNSASRGQGRFLLSVSRQPKLARETQWPKNNTGSGYLGYGLMENNQAAHRQGIREGVDFALRLCFKPKTPQADIEEIKTTLHAWSLFGGLGSRARRGFGSVTLRQMNGEDAALDQAGFELAVQNVLHNTAVCAAFPPYTAFSNHARFAVLATATDARQAHSQSGQRYKTHRGQSSALRGADKIPFGLPLQGIDQDSRRASPLLFHVHALRHGQFAAAALYLPAHFHHDPRYQTSDLAAFNHEVAQFLPILEPRP
jgi:CRISPR-associated protein Cmr1